MAFGGIQVLLGSVIAGRFLSTREFLLLVLTTARSVCSGLDEKYTKHYKPIFRLRL